MIEYMHLINLMANPIHVQVKQLLIFCITQQICSHFLQVYFFITAAALSAPPCPPPPRRRRDFCRGARSPLPRLPPPLSPGSPPLRKVAAALVPPPRKTTPLRSTLQHLPPPRMPPQRFPPHRKGAAALAASTCLRRGKPPTRSPLPPLPPQRSPPLVRLACACRACRARLARRAWGLPRRCCRHRTMTDRDRNRCKTAYRDSLPPSPNRGPSSSPGYAGGGTYAGGGALCGGGGTCPYGRKRRDPG